MIKNTTKNIDNWSFQGTHKTKIKANILAKREFDNYYNTKVVKEKNGYTIYIKPLIGRWYKKENKK